MTEAFPWDTAPRYLLRDVEQAIRRLFVLFGGYVMPSAAI
jgi:hypothetical protein